MSHYNPDAAEVKLSKTQLDTLRAGGVVSLNAPYPGESIVIYVSDG